jgi:hypothetical protein
MLFPTDNKVMKITKNNLLKVLKETIPAEISILEPIDKSNLRQAKTELDKQTRNGEISIVMLRHKK